MKHWLIVILILFFGLNLKGQTASMDKEGVVSYITSQNVYVKFPSTEQISKGDTLFGVQDSKKIPLLIVKELSSISCVCALISTKTLSVNDKVYAGKKMAEPVKKEVVEVVTINPPDVIKKDTVAVKKEIPTPLKQKISGRISISSYSDFSNVSDFSQRMRYNFSLDAKNIGNSKLSAETYISFVHSPKLWEEIKSNIFNGLKIYSLAVNYAINKNNNVWVGRKINMRLSSVGAIDGLQYETKVKSFTAGIIAGTRPDYLNYSLNTKLFQFGGYLGHDYLNKQGGLAQTSLAIVQQTNQGNIDRRFAYVQHSNSLITNLYFFGSVEFDLFNKVLNRQDSSLTQNNSPRLSNIYVSLRYKISKKVSVTVSYNERQNIIYYETYKSIIEQLHEEATMKGYTLQLTYRPIKMLAFGANASYRFSKQDVHPSKNLYTYLTYGNIPWLNASATLSATLMETSYITGSIYSLGLSRDIVPGKLFGEVSYRYVDYKFINAETPLVQNMGEVNLTWRIMKKLSLSINYEGTFEKGRNYDRIYLNITQRF